MVAEGFYEMNGAENYAWRQVIRNLFRESTDFDQGYWESIPDEARDRLVEEFHKLGKSKLKGIARKVWEEI